MDLTALNPVILTPSLSQISVLDEADTCHCSASCGAGAGGKCSCGADCGGGA